MSRQNRIVFAAIGILAAGTIAASNAVHAAPVSYTAPDETAAFRKGPGIEAAEGNCTACHSAEYVNSQPRGAGFGKDFWQAEVTKMINVYRAPIAPDDAKAVVDYLAATYK